LYEVQQVPTEGQEFTWSTHMKSGDGAPPEGAKKDEGPIIDAEVVDDKK
jgi:hypothetical protein